MSLQVWLPLNGNFLNHGIDVPVITNVGTVEYGAGKTGEFSLFSQTSCFYFPWTHAETNQFSFSAWVNGTDPWAWQDILSFGEGLNRIEIDNTLSTYRWYCTSGPALMTSGTAIFTLPKNEWHHITMTADGSYVTFYIDGSQASRHTQTNSVSSCFSTNQTVRIASRTDGGGSLWRGYINDVRLYDHALSQHEIERDYCSLLVHYPLRDPYVENTVNLLSNGKFDGYGGLTINISNYQYKNNTNVCTITTSNSGVNTGSARAYIPLSVLTNGTSYSLSYKWKLISGKGSLKPGDWCDGSVTIKKNFYNGIYNEVEVFLPARYAYDSTYRFLDFNEIGSDSVYEIWDVQLERKDYATPYADNNRIGEKIYDCSGRGYHSVDRGNLTVSADSGRNSYCTTFPINNSIKFPSPYGATTTQLTDFSVAMWLKLADNAGRYKTVFSTWFGNNASGTMGWLGVNTENKDLWFYNGQYHGVGSGSYPLNEWHHIVMTYKNGAAQWYMDGEAYGSPISDTTGYVNAYEFFGLGDSYTNSGWDGANFTGSISDFRFYGTAIPATAVKDLYYNGATIDNANNIHTFEFVEV